MTFLLIAVGMLCFRTNFCCQIVAYRRYFPIWRL